MNGSPYWLPLYIEFLANVGTKSDAVDALMTSRALYSRPSLAKPA